MHVCGEGVCVCGVCELCVYMHAMFMCVCVCGGGVQACVCV